MFDFLGSEKNILCCGTERVERHVWLTTVPRHVASPAYKDSAALLASFGMQMNHQTPKQGVAHLQLKLT